MSAPMLLTISAAVAVHSIVSPIPELRTELYVLPYIAANLIFTTHLILQHVAYSAILFSLMATNITFLLTSATLTIAHRLLLSPLRKFPGPKLAAVSGLWNANECRLGRASKTHRALHQHFKSDIVRIGPNELSINNVDAIDKFYGGKYLRGNLNQVFNISGGDNIATLRDHKIHGPWKRMWWAFPTSISCL
jgi:hypothetical protein